jgi:hypothetical protein
MFLPNTTSQACPTPKKKNKPKKSAPRSTSTSKKKSKIREETKINLQIACTQIAIYRRDSSNSIKISKHSGMSRSVVLRESARAPAFLGRRKKVETWLIGSR